MDRQPSSVPWIGLGLAGATWAAMLACFVAIMIPLQAHAQVSNAQVVASCGAQAYTAGQNRALSQDTTGKLCGGTTGSNVGGYSFQLSPTITVQNAAYSAGNSEGGLITVTGAARTNGGSGVLMNLRMNSNGGSTNTGWIYAWSKTPSSTCTDKSAFVKNTADNAYAIPGFPQAFTLGAAPGSWDTSTSAQLVGLNTPFKNQDVSPGTAIYICIVTGASVTPAATTDLSLVVNGLQD